MSDYACTHLANVPSPPHLLSLPKGAGKTTLLRLLANKELRLPSGLSVLHVEQEVTGDDTLALDSVLQCDTEREQLLSRERELLAAADKSQVEVYVCNAFASL